MGPETPITTLKNGLRRAMRVNSTATSTLAAIGLQITDPVTVEGVSAVFEAGSNQTIIRPFLVGAENVTGKLRLWGRERHTGPILIVISGASKASPVVITATAHGLSTGDTVLINSVAGMVELNGLQHDVTVTGANTFTIPVDSTGFSTYSSGGTATKESGQTWLQTFIGQWDLTAGGATCLGIAGGPILITERFADTLVPDVAAGINNSLINIQTHSPATDGHADIPGSIVIDQLGMPRIEARFDRGTAAEMNLLVRSL